MQWPARILAAPLALSAHGVWNQHLLDSMTTFFAEHGADA